MIIIDSKGIELSVAKATLQSQMSVHPFICLSSKPPSTLILHLSTFILHLSTFIHNFATFKLFSLFKNKFQGNLEPKEMTMSVKILIESKTDAGLDQ